jgi:hypothetical protein
MRPVVDGLVKQYAGRYDIKVVNLSLNNEADRALYQSFGLQYVPTFVFLNADGSRSGTIVGSTSVQKIEAELAKLK